MRRREFIRLFGGAVVAWPVVARAQQAARPIVGFLRSASLAPFQNLVVAFGQGLKEAGFVAGENVAIEYRYADNQIDRLPALVADLIRLPVAVIVVNSGAAFAAKAATTTVPIVFAAGDDPVKSGVVPSLNRPGGNITGVTWLGGLVGAKRLELLRQVVPKSKRTCELTSSIVPRGTSFHRWVELDFPPIAFDAARSSRCCSGPGPAELGTVNPDAVHDHGQSPRQRDDRLFHPAAPGDLHRPSLEPGPFLRTQHALRCFVKHDPHHLIAAARYSAAAIDLAGLILGARQPKYRPD
jgi:hypothetical protein